MTNTKSRQPDSKPRLGYLLRQAAAAHRWTVERALADLEVTPPQFLALRMLTENPGSSNAELSRLAALTTPTVTVIVANLARRGALTRRPHAVHGRVRHLDLTPKGTALLAACEKRVVKAEKALAAGLSSAQTAVIARWLRRSAEAGR